MTVPTVERGLRDVVFCSIEMAGLSLGVAGFSFLVGYLMRTFFGIEV